MKIAASGKKILFNLSNIHSGGALQVAISVVSEMLKFDCLKGCKILVSTEIADSLDLKQASNSDFEIDIYNTYGFRGFFSRLNVLQYHYDIVFTLFGPKYTLLKSKCDVVGFAQFWILEFDNPVSRSMSTVSRVFLKLKFTIQKFFFKRADHLVVELEHVKEALVRQGVFPGRSISVVHNTISGLYLDDSTWQVLNMADNEGYILIGYVTRDYPHKNISILADVASILRDHYGFPVKFVFTLNDDEWKRHSDSFEGFGETVGSLNVYQCPSFYEKMDAVIFPSLLECFSSAPLEALVMKKPLFASDRGFVRDVCGSHAIYFDPFSADSIAKVIAAYFEGGGKSESALEAARSHALSFSTAQKRAIDYLQVIDSLIVRCDVQ